MSGKITKFISKSDVLEVKENGIVDIQITRYGVYDADKDRVMEGALTRTWNNGGQVHLVNHNLRELTSFVGLPIKTFPESGIVRSQLNLKKQAAIDLYNDYQFCKDYNRSMQHSHGFRPIKENKNERKGRDFHEIHQFEYSSVLFGAVSDTPLLDIKSAIEMESYINEFEFYLKRFNGTDEGGKEAEKIIKSLKDFHLKHSSEDTAGDGNNDPSGDTQYSEQLIKSLTELNNKLK